jgi:hypothetical protein
LGFESGRMMIISYSDAQQDTTRLIKVVINESIREKTFSLPEVKKFPSLDSARYARRAPTITGNEVLADTTSVCKRNIIADITFNDSNNFIARIDPGFRNSFPFIFTEKNKLRQTEANATLVRHLKPGENLTIQPLHNDWIILIILISSFLYSIIRTTSRNIFPGIIRFFLFRGINDPSSRDTGGLFNWQSTVLNLASFLIIGLFTYCFALFYDLIPAGLTSITGYLISLGIIISAVTLRHIVCFITGYISGQNDVFGDYLVGVYQSYRLSAMVLFFIIILLSYTLVLPTSVFFISGITALGLLYLIRIIRLLIIFINRNISIFYLILYLCALEILPVGISVKYFTGLF